MQRFNIMAAKPYIDKQSQEQKTKWVKLGSIVIMQDNQGKQKMFGDLDCIPAGAWFDGSIQLFEADQQQGGGNAPQQNQHQGGQQNHNQPQQQYGQPQQGQQQYHQ